MPVLNPFLRALFQSSVLGHALPAQNYVLLVPTTESLLYGQDRETNKRYTDHVEDEDFLGSHILRIIPTTAEKDGNVRDGRGKAKNYSTVNGRTVILKENTVYSNKGFKHLNQATLLSDLLYYSPGNDMQQWLVYYISKPLTGLFEALPIKPAIIGETRINHITPGTSSTSSEPPTPKKKDIKTFGQLLENFPMIQRQMQPGLERLFNEFSKELGKPLPPPPSRSPTPSTLDGTTQASETGSVRSNGSVKLPFNSPAYFEDEEDLMRTALETAVTAAIDLFQGVDKQQLSYLGATTDLTGPDVEKLIERYVAEYVHPTLLFPRLCAFHKAQDQELDRRIRQMECLDVSQVGIVLEDGRNGKRDLINRVNRGVAVFRRMGVAGVLKKCSIFFSRPKKHLQARLSYMQRFIYIDDVESGEIGYSLSTLEAVLTYLARDAGGLRKASKQNQLLWKAVKSGKIDDVRSIFEESAIMSDGLVEEPAEVPLSRRTTASTKSSESCSRATLSRTSSSEGGLSHVFPFQAAERKNLLPKQKKKVQMAARSMSVSSAFSHSSRAATIETSLSGIEGDTSVQSLAQTQDAVGNSVLMMAVENQRPECLRYLLSLTEHYSPEGVLSDVTQEGATLLSAAVQLANMDLVNIILGYAEQHADEQVFREYLSVKDSRGRSVAHYLFNTPQLIKRLANVLPWRQKDKIGHTPLFAICRSYDHADYSSMVSEALTAAKEAQQDGGPLRMEDHIDNKGNSLLHIVNDATIMQRILQTCEVDLNAMNDKKFTPLMLASKYGRVDMVRIFLSDPRIDLHLRESRGLTAVELAKDDEVRNRIDDLTLFSPANTADGTGRITAIVRSFFVEDGSTRFILKSGAPNPAVSSTTYTITTSRRSLQDFENLAKWLLMDFPASYMPTMLASNFRNPFQLHSRPSRAALYDIQTSLDRFLKILLKHPTFSTHEMLWEFFLVPDMLQEQMADRARLKAELIREKINDEYDPLISRADMIAVDGLVSHSRDIVRKINICTRSSIRKGHAYVQAHADFAEALSLCSVAFATMGSPATTLSKMHVDSFLKFAALMHSEPASSPLQNYVCSLSSFHSTVAAVQSALLKPSALIDRITAAQRAMDKDKSNLVNNSIPRKGVLKNLNLPFPGTEESRIKVVKDTEKKILERGLEIDKLGRELRYSQEVVVGELAGWTTWRQEWGRAEMKRLARGIVVREQERLRGMQRILRALKGS
ncbi:Ankyrin repeat-containing protein [Cladophialophora immunda]|nr:Ankyrin repeat-containing protein [Cladophialophora immunda]